MPVRHASSSPPFCRPITLRARVRARAPPYLIVRATVTPLSKASAGETLTAAVLCAAWLKAAAAAGQRRSGVLGKKLYGAELARRRFDGDQLDCCIYMTCYFMNTHYKEWRSNFSIYNIPTWCNNFSPGRPWTFQ